MHDPPQTKPSVFLVTHLLPDRPFFVDAVAAVSEICSLIPKRRSVDLSVVSWLKHKYPIHNLRRDDFSNSTRMLEFISGKINSQHIALLDIGGYFSHSLHALAKRFVAKQVFAIEDTENGLRRYKDLRELPCPVVSVARSPLKNPEDYLVGQSIVFSTEALLREMGDILHGRTACMIGYGKIGKSIANLLHSRHVQVVVFDKNPVTRVEALSHGFRVGHDLASCLSGAGLVFCATGNFALKDVDFERLEHG